MSMFQRRKGRSLYSLRNKTGITRITFFMKNNVQNYRFLDVERFISVIENSNLPIVGGGEVHYDERNSMQGIFDLVDGE